MKHIRAKSQKKPYMANTVCPTRIDVRMTIYAHVIIALTPIHILSSSLTLTLIQIVSSRTKAQTQQGPTKRGWSWDDGVSVATVLVFAKCFGAHSVPLLPIVHHSWHNIWIRISPYPNSTTPIHLIFLVLTRMRAYTDNVCMDAFT